jgi:NADPH-dependent 2,4-dienoyl-CoA reductase/sulfur reductase-like enzyme
MGSTPMCGIPGSYDVVILGAGYAGLMAAVRLTRRKWPMRIALISDRDQFLEAFSRKITESCFNGTIIVRIMNWRNFIFCIKISGTFGTDQVRPVLAK